MARPGPARPIERPGAVPRLKPGRAGGRAGAGDEGRGRKISDNGVALCLPSSDAVKLNTYVFGMTKCILDIVLSASEPSTVGKKRKLRVEPKTSLLVGRLSTTVPMEMKLN